MPSGQSTWGKEPKNYGRWKFWDRFEEKHMKMGWNDKRIYFFRFLLFIIHSVYLHLHEIYDTHTIHGIVTLYVLIIMSTRCRKLNKQQWHHVLHSYQFYFVVRQLTNLSMNIFKIITDDSKYTRKTTQRNKTDKAKYYSSISAKNVSIIQRRVDHNILQ